MLRHKVLRNSRKIKPELTVNTTDGVIIISSIADLIAYFHEGIDRQNAHIKVGNRWFSYLFNDYKFALFMESACSETDFYVFLSADESLEKIQSAFASFCETSLPAHTSKLVRGFLDCDRAFELFIVNTKVLLAILKTCDDETNHLVLDKIIQNDKLFHRVTDNPDHLNSYICKAPTVFAERLFNAVMANQLYWETHSKELETGHRCVMYLCSLFRNLPPRFGLPMLAKLIDGNGFKSITRPQSNVASCLVNGLDRPYAEAILGQLTASIETWLTFINSYAANVGIYLIPSPLVIYHNYSTFLNQIKNGSNASVYIRIVLQKLNEFGIPIIHYAIRTQLGEICWLLEHGADPHLVTPDFQYDTLAHFLLASENLIWSEQHTKTALILLEHAKNPRDPAYNYEKLLKKVALTVPQYLERFLELGALPKDIQQFIATNLCHHTSKNVSISDQIKAQLALLQRCQLSADSQAMDNIILGFKQITELFPDFRKFMRSQGVYVTMPETFDNLTASAKRNALRKEFLLHGNPQQAQRNAFLSFCLVLTVNQTPKNKGNPLFSLPLDLVLYIARFMNLNKSHEECAALFNACRAQQDSISAMMNEPAGVCVLQQSEANGSHHFQFFISSKALADAYDEIPQENKSKRTEFRNKAIPHLNRELTLFKNPARSIAKQANIANRDLSIDLQSVYKL